MKRIRSSKRGLTFSFHEMDNFRIGSKFTYYIGNGQIIICPNEHGYQTISRKKVGDHFLPLIDLRKKDIIEKITSADYMEISFEADRIVVSLCKKITESAAVQNTDNLISITDILRAERIETFYCTNAELMAAGAEYQVFKDTPETEDSHIKKDFDRIFRVVSLFSGAGMFDYPFHMDKNFEIIFACDYDYAATRSYMQNIGVPAVCSNISDIHNVNPAEVVIGGPSCKAFSNANRHTRLLKHSDYYLIREYIRIVKEVQPLIFVIENVPEFLTAGNGELLSEIKDALWEYHITCNIAVDADCGGYTSRKRAFIIGSKIGAVHLPNMRMLPHKTVREALSKVDNTWFNYNDISISKPATIEKMKYIGDGQNWTSLPEPLQGRGIHSNHLRRLHPERICPAIANIRKLCLMPPLESKNPHRILSVAEASALSGFPKNFRFLGTLAERQQQVANGVPFSLGKLVKDTIKRALLNHYPLPVA